MDRLGFYPSEMLEEVANRNVWRLSLELLSPKHLQTRAGSGRRRKKTIESLDSCLGSEKIFEAA